MIKDSEATDCSISFSVTPVQARALNLPRLLIDSYKICRKPKIDSYKDHPPKIVYCRTGFKASPSFIGARLLFFFLFQMVLKFLNILLFIMKSLINTAL